jgi:hypothetical protein
VNRMVYSRGIKPLLRGFTHAILFCFCYGLWTVDRGLRTFLAFAAVGGRHSFHKKETNA